MTASVLQLPTRDRPHARYPDDLDLRSIIRQGEQLDARLTYCSDVWDFTGSPEMSRETPVIRFDRIPAPFRELAKDTVLLLGDPGLARQWAPGAAADIHAARRRANWRTASNVPRRAVGLLRLLDRLGMYPMALGDWDDLAEEAKNRPQENPQTHQYTTMTSETLVRAAQALREMHDLAPLHGRVNPFGSRPWGVDEVNARVGHRPPVMGEHRNANRPHGHVFAMAGACINMLERCTDDLIARAEWWTVNSDVDWDEVAPDPYLVAHPAETRPTWLPEDHHLLPDPTAATGLWWWTNRLVIASYYVLAAVVALRGQEIDALQPDCITTINNRHRMRGIKVKNQGEQPPETSWWVNDFVVSAVTTVNRLRRARGLPEVQHPRFPDRRVLFAANLMSGAAQNRRTRKLLSRPIAPHNQQQWLVPAFETLAEAGAGVSVADLDLQSHTVVRITALDVHVDRPLGDLAAAAVGKWSTLGVALGYYGHRPQITVPAWSDDVEEHRDARGVGRLLTDVAGEEPPLLTGGGAEGLKRRVAADPRLFNGPVTLKTLKAARRRNHASVSIGPLAACLTPEGGLCSSKDEADHRLCQLGCRNMILTPYHRARLELTARSMTGLLGTSHPLAAKVDDHDDLITEERGMTDAQLIDVITAEWDPNFRGLIYDLIGSAA
ncbi:MAG: hypothetical protein ACR2HR_04410 [Euzebya sp.]